MNLGCLCSEGYGAPETLKFAPSALLFNTLDGSAGGWSAPWYCPKGRCKHSLRLGYLEPRRAPRRAMQRIVSKPHEYRIKMIQSQAINDTMYKIFAENYQRNR